MSAPYRQGQPQWPENRPQRPERPPPIQFRPEAPPPRRPNPVVQWGLRILGLVAVAVISGLVWTYVTSDSSSTANNDATGDENQVQEGKFRFTPHPSMPESNKVTDCPAHAYGKIQQFLTTTKCESLTRALYVTKVRDGRQVYASVSVVRMANAEEAEALRGMTDTDNTGNVSDVVRDRVVTVEGLDRLSGGNGYDSTQQERDVVIVEADFDPKGKKGGGGQADEDLLDSVCEDALRLGSELAENAG